MKTNNQAKQPECSFRAGGVRASVWKWTDTTKDGKTFERLKVLLERTYRDAAGEWKSTSSYGANDVPKAILALSRAYAYLQDKPQEQASPAVFEEEFV